MESNIDWSMGEYSNNMENNTENEMENNVENNMENNMENNIENNNMKRNIEHNNNNMDNNSNDMDNNNNIDNNNINNNIDDNNNIDNNDMNSNNNNNFEQKKQNMSDENDDNSLKFFVGGIPPDCWESDILKHFSAYGSVKEVQVMRDPVTCRNRGFCFVTMTNKSAHDSIFNSVHTIKKKKVEVREMQMQNLNRKIFVGGINSNITEGDLKDYFSKYGEVEKVTIMRDPEEKRSRGFGFIIFTEENVVRDVLKIKVHKIQDHKIDVRPAETRPKNYFKNSIGGGSVPLGYYGMYNQWGGGVRGYMNRGMYGYGGNMRGGAYMSNYNALGGMPSYIAPRGVHTPPFSPYLYGAYSPGYGPQRSSSATPRGHASNRMGPY